MLQLYKNIKKRRLELGLTQSDLAKIMGYADKSMIAKIESGNIDLPQSKIISFANALHVSPPNLMGWEETSLVTNYLKMLQSCNIDYECVVGDGTESSIYIIKTSNGELKISYKQLIELAENTKAFLYSDLMEFLFRQKKNLLLASKENFLKDKKKTYNYTITSAARGEGLEKHTVQSDLSPEEIAKINKDSALERDDKLF